MTEIEALAREIAATEGLPLAQARQQAQAEYCSLIRLSGEWDTDSDWQASLGADPALSAFAADWDRRCQAMERRQTRRQRRAA